VGTSPLSPEEIRAAAEVHSELGPQYSDAVVQSFLDKVDKEVEARIASRIAALPEERRSSHDPATLARRRAFAAGTAAGVVITGIPLSLLVVHLAHSFQQPLGPLLAIWIVIGVIFTAAVAGLTGAVTVRVPPRVRRARSAPVASRQQRPQLP
jgi:hypothetical protein